MTIAELKQLIANCPDETPVHIITRDPDGCTFHTPKQVIWDDDTSFDLETAD